MSSIRLSAILLAIATSAASADVVTLGASADAFVAAADPAENFGGAGALAAAAPGLPNGEFQSFMQFNTLAAKQAFDLSFGAGNWQIQSVTIRLTSAAAGNPLFNADAAGQFIISWIQDDAWVEGTGTPNSPGETGVTFDDVPALIAPGEESLGTFDYDGVPGVTTVRTLPLTPQFLAELLAGATVSLRFRAADPDIAMIVNSRNYRFSSNRPAFAITAVAVPGCYANCDGSTVAPILNANDFECFLNAFAAGNSYANCDGSTVAPVLNANDFECFLNAFAAGCS